MNVFIISQSNICEFEFAVEHLQLWFFATAYYFTLNVIFISICPAERSHGGSCDLKPSEHNSTLRKELKQFFGWMRKHSYGCTNVSIKLYDQWRVWLQKAQKTHDQVSKDKAYPVLRRISRRQIITHGTHEIQPHLVVLCDPHKREPKYLFTLLINRLAFDCVC